MSNPRPWSVVSTGVKLYVAWPRVRRRGEEWAYARKVVLRTFLDLRRKPWHRERSTAELPDVRQPDDVGAQVGDRVTVLEALGRLPRGMRAVVVCRFWEGLSVEQTSDALSLSVGTVKSQTAKALAKLRDDLGVANTTSAGEMS
jgi:RNA polymerase sigma factor (sigma-70 family)